MANPSSELKVFKQLRYYSLKLFRLECGSQARDPIDWFQSMCDYLAARLGGLACELDDMPIVQAVTLLRREVSRLSGSAEDADTFLDSGMVSSCGQTLAGSTNPIIINEVWTAPDAGTTDILTAVSSGAVLTGVVCPSAASGTRDLECASAEQAPPTERAWANPMGECRPTRRDYQVQLGRGLVYRGSEHPLTPQQVKLMAFFLTRESANSEEVVGHVWGDTPIADGTIRSAISRLDSRLNEIGVPLHFSSRQGQISLLSSEQNTDRLELTGL